MGNPSSEHNGRPQRVPTGLLVRSACALGLVGGLVIGACAGTDQNLERQRLLDEVNAAGSGKAAQCRPGIVEACYDGADGSSGRGICKAGNRTCSEDAVWGACSGQVLPRKELCNRLDDDCDGIIDNDFERDGASCSVGVGQCKTSGTWRCNPDGLGATCDAPQPKIEAEVCDGIDNNCDGQIDNNVPGTGVACQTGKPGVCGAGTMKCLGGQMICSQNVEATQEICNGLDDDCNNIVDDRCLTQEEYNKLKARSP